MSCLSSAAFLSCSVSAVPLACRVSRTLFSFWYALQYCNMSCLSPAAFLSCSISFLLSLFLIVSLPQYSPIGMLYSTATMTFYSNSLITQRSFFFQCLIPCLVSLPPRFYHAVSPPSLSPVCLSYITLLLVCFTALQQ